MKKMSWQKGDVKKKLADFLLCYRKTPHTTTNEAPAMLLMKRIPRSRIDLCHPNLKNTVENKQEAQKRNHDVHAKQKRFDAETKVWARNYWGGEQWRPGVVTKQTGWLPYHRFFVLWNPDLLER